MKKGVRNLGLCCIAALLSACAALQIDVDVYKGPLSDEKDVQTEQPISLALTSQRLLMDLQRQLMKDLDYGKNYKYAHSYQNNFINQEFLPEEISKTKLYEPGNNTRENSFREALKNRWKGKYDY